MGLQRLFYVLEGLRLPVQPAAAAGKLMVKLRPVLIRHLILVFLEFLFQLPGLLIGVPHLLLPLRGFPGNRDLQDVQLRAEDFRLLCLGQNSSRVLILAVADEHVRRQLIDRRVARVDRLRLVEIIHHALAVEELKGAFLPQHIGVEIPGVVPDQGVADRPGFLEPSRVHQNLNLLDTMVPAARLLRKRPVYGRQSLFKEILFFLFLSAFSSKHLEGLGHDLEGPRKPARDPLPLPGSALLLPVPGRGLLFDAGNARFCFLRRFPVFPLHKKAFGKQVVVLSGLRPSHDASQEKLQSLFSLFVLQIAPAKLQDIPVRGRPIRHASLIEPDQLPVDATHAFQKGLLLGA